MNLVCLMVRHACRTVALLHRPFAHQDLRLAYAHLEVESPIPSRAISGSLSCWPSKIGAPEACISGKMRSLSCQKTINA